MRDAPTQQHPSRAASWRHTARSFIWQSPAVYLPLARRRYPGPSPTVVGDGTDLVIDGYMRSANTYAVHAFQSAQRHPVRLAHHLHAPAQLIEAARRDLPALALIREPEGAVLSQVQWEPGVSMPAALASYVRFYRTLLPYSGHFVVATFEEVTSAFGDVTRRLNDRFGTDFGIYERTEEHERLVVELMQERAADVPAWRALILGYESGTVSLDHVLAERGRFASAGSTGDGRAWSPSDARRRTKEGLRRRWNEPDLGHLRVEAASIYGRFASSAGEIAA